MPLQFDDLAIGTRHRLNLLVDERATVPALSHTLHGFSDMPPVFATAMMVGFIEWACVELLRPVLPDGHQTVGTHIDVSHVSATPIGMNVVAEVELVQIKSRTLRFKVRCTDEGGLIGEGTHERAIIERAKFLSRVLKKRSEHT